jgi:hypothetical protein
MDHSVDEDSVGADAFVVRSDHAVLTHGAPPSKAGRLGRW